MKIVRNASDPIPRNFTPRLPTIRRRGEARQKIDLPPFRGRNRSEGPFSPAGGKFFYREGEARQKWKAKPGKNEGAAKTRSQPETSSNLPATLRPAPAFRNNLSNRCRASAPLSGRSCDLPPGAPRPGRHNPARPTTGGFSQRVPPAILEHGAPFN